MADTADQLIPWETPYKRTDPRLTTSQVLAGLNEINVNIGGLKDLFDTMIGGDPSQVGALLKDIIQRSRYVVLAATRLLANNEAIKGDK